MSEATKHVRKWRPDAIEEAMRARTTTDWKRWFAENTCREHMAPVAKEADSIVYNEVQGCFVLTFARFAKHKPSYLLTPEITQAFNECARGRARIELLTDDCGCDVHGGRGRDGR